MSLVKANNKREGMHYEAMPVHQSKKQDLRVISEMSSHKILAFLMYRHRVGLLATSNMLLVGFVCWDKIARVLF